MILFSTKQNTLDIQICLKDWFIKNIDEKLIKKYQISITSLYLQFIKL